MSPQFNPFYPRQSQRDKEKYQRLIIGMAQISYVFSQSDKPYLDYRVAENIFCKAFSAENYTRQDLSVDAVKIRDGIGIKTFISGSARCKSEKIAEFVNRERYPLNENNINEMIWQVAAYRNHRLNETIRRFDLANTVYHYLVRDTRRIHICECAMMPIDINSINIPVNNNPRGNKVIFNDRNFAYYFHLSKHTLFKKFDYVNPFHTLTIGTQRDNDLIIWAISELDERVSREEPLLQDYDYVFLPLYSTRTGEVPERSGLNQWNARGRSRDLNEVYIPIPRAVHIRKPSFFPPRNQRFTLRATGDREFSAKVCQDNSKALMTDPNSSLGEWLLREQLGFGEGRIITYEDLRNRNIDSVIIYKIHPSEYEIRLHFFGGYESE